MIIFGSDETSFCDLFTIKSDIVSTISVTCEFSEGLMAISNDKIHFFTMNNMCSWVNFSTIWTNIIAFAIYFDDLVTDSGTCVFVIEMISIGKNTFGLDTVFIEIDLYTVYGLLTN